MKRRVAALALITGTCALLAAREARADLPVEIEVGPRVGAGTNPALSGLNPLGFGVGARAGAIFRNVYAGGNLTYYFGERSHDTVTLTSLTSLQAGFEAGYGFTYSILTVRPELGVGNITVTRQDQTTTPTQGAQSSTNSVGFFYLEPGVVALVSIGFFYLGADVNLLILPNGGSTSTTLNGSSTGPVSTTNAAAASLTAHTQIGVRF